MLFNLVGLVTLPKSLWMVHVLIAERDDSTLVTVFQNYMLGKEKLLLQLLTKLELKSLLVFGNLCLKTPESKFCSPLGLSDTCHVSIYLELSFISIA